MPKLIAKPSNRLNRAESRHKLIGLQSLISRPEFKLSDWESSIPQPLPGRDDFALCWTGEQLQIRLTNDAGSLACDVALDQGADWRGRLYEALVVAYERLDDDFLCPKALEGQKTTFRKILFAPRSV